MSCENGKATKKQTQKQSRRKTECGFPTELECITLG